MRSADRSGRQLVHGVARAGWGEIYEDARAQGHDDQERRSDKPHCVLEAEPARPLMRFHGSGVVSARVRGRRDDAA